MLTYSRTVMSGERMDKNEMMERQLVALQSLNMVELKARFLELYGFECGATNVKGLRNRIAYKLQEIYLGGLSEEDKNLLEKLADKDPGANLNFTDARPRPPAKGARLRREWRGKTYEVIVCDDGRFEYNGEIYRSLTSVAKVITGTHWNGKKFFGVI